MKKIVGIFIVLVLLAISVSIAFGEKYQEAEEFCKRYYYLNKFVTEEGYYGNYNIVNGVAYAISNISDEEDFNTKDKFMENYVSMYLAPHWETFSNEVDVQYFEVVQESENYTYLIVELTLRNGKTMNEYLESEPTVNKIVGIIPFDKTVD